MIKSSKFVAEVAAKATVPPWVILTGAEEFLRSDALGALRRSLGEDVDFVSFEWRELGDEDGFLTIVDELRTMSLFSSSKIVHVAHAQKFLKEHGDALARLVSDGSAGPIAVFEDDEIIKRKAKKLPKAVAAMVEAGGVAVDCGTLYATPFGFSRPVWDSDLSKWVVERARTFGKRIDLQTAYALHSREASGLRGIATQLEKIALAIGERNEITHADLDRFLGENEQASLFDVVDRFAAKDTQGTLGGLSRLFQQGVKNHNGAKSIDEMEITMRLLALLSTRMRELGRIFELRRAGQDMESSLADVVGRGRKFLFAKFRDQLSARTPKELGQVVLEIVELDRSLKSGRGNPRDLLTFFVLKSMRVGRQTG